jgi:TetR/AcrR family transcriptional repressor of lmrAB and yxaGH operons
MSITRDHIIDVTCELLEAQGYHATGLNQIVKESGAPKGSLYYYFPDGKEELTSEAIDRTGRHLAERIRLGLSSHEDAGTAVRAFVHNIANAVESSGFRAGGPLTMVAMEMATSSERLNNTCRDAFRQIQAAFESKLTASGFTQERAAQLAVFITSSIEGGIMLSRTYHSGDPLRRVADELERVLKAG